jgi:multiple sugar transport system permease protein
MIRKPAIPLRLAVTLAAFGFAIIVNLPFFWMLVTSFKTEDQAFAIPPSFLPTIYDLRNYIKAFQLVPLGRYVLNTLFWLSR